MNKTDLTRQKTLDTARILGGSSNGKTTDFGSVDAGSTPAPLATQTGQGIIQQVAVTATSAPLTLSGKEEWTQNYRARANQLRATGDSSAEQPFSTAESARPSRSAARVPQPFSSLSRACPKN